MKYVKPDYVLGYSLLTKSQIEQTLSLLNYDSSKIKRRKTMTTEVYSSIMNVANDDSFRNYIPLLKLQKLGKNKPLEVNIVTPQNITKVTADMYRNAACYTWIGSMPQIGQ